MSRESMKRLSVYVAVIAALAVGVGCSVDSPTTPIQQPQAPPGSNPVNGTWNIVLDANPKSIPGGGTASVEIDVRAPDGSRPANGTLMQVNVNRGQFLGTGLGSAAVQLSNGKSAVEVLATAPTGTFLISGEIRVTASLQGNSNSTRINVTDAALPVQAAFTFTIAGLEVGFNNTSTGATSYTWDFGDGGTSGQREPTHTYSEAGAYLVSLRARNQVNEDITFATVTVADPVP